MARLLLIPTAAFVLLAALMPLFVAGVSGTHGATEALSDPALAATLQTALIAAAAVAALAVPLALILALALWRAAPTIRGVALAFCVILLLVPAPGFTNLHFLIPPQPLAAFAFLCAVARGTALALFFLSAGLTRIPATLLTAAHAAGARPLQAWRHAILTPLAGPLLGAALSAFVVGLVEGPAAAILAPHFDLADAWIAPAALLLAAASVAALGVLLRRRAA